MRHRGWAVVLFTALLVWPFPHAVPYDLINTAILACENAIVAISLVLLIGLVGQISLCQAALVGMGAFVSALATRDLGVHFPLTLVVGTVAGALTAVVIGGVALRVRGLYLAVATLIFAYVADQYLFLQPWLVQSQSGTSIGLETVGRPGSLPFLDLTNARVYYFVALAAAGVCLYGTANLRDSRVGRAFAAVRGSEMAAASLGIDVARFKLVGFAVAGAMAGLGGAITLVGNRTVAPDQFNYIASLDFLAIAVVGGLRSLGGAVSSALLFAVLVGEVFYHFPAAANYLDLISALLLIAVLLFFRGGLGALPGRLGRLWKRLAPVISDRVLRRRAGQQLRRGPAEGTVRFQNPVARLKAVAHVVRLKVRPGEPAVASNGKRAQSAPGSGDAASLYEASAADRFRDQRTPIDVIGLVSSLHAPEGGDTPETGTGADLERTPGEPETIADSEPTGAGEARATLAGTLGDSRVAGEAGPDGRRMPVLLSASGITVRFGGLTAVDNVSLEVAAGEIVGLIGPNGAGKTTMFNALLGLNSPVAGAVELFGQDVSGWPVHARAALGVGRTFQILQLFADLSVFDNLLVATHLQNPSGVWASLLSSPRALHAEHAARARVEAVLQLMGLDELAQRRVGDLPFGVLRLVEVARTLVTGARLVCFDEPASGLDSVETERLIEWFRLLRQMGVTLLVIEHDVGMVVSLCDHIYVMDQGRLIADGPPQAISRDPAVVASYLGKALVEVA